jgi:hypothetical protein
MNNYELTAESLPGKVEEIRIVSQSGTDNQQGMPNYLSGVLFDIRVLDGKAKKLEQTPAVVAERRKLAFLQDSVEGNLRNWTRSLGMNFGTNNSNRSNRNSNSQKTEEANYSNRNNDPKGGKRKTLRRRKNTRKNARK